MYWPKISGKMCVHSFDGGKHDKYGVSNQWKGFVSRLRKGEILPEAMATEEAARRTLAKCLELPLDNIFTRAHPGCTDTHVLKKWAEVPAHYKVLLLRPKHTMRICIAFDPVRRFLDVYAVFEATHEASVPDYMPPHGGDSLFSRCVVEAEAGKPAAHASSVAAILVSPSGSRVKASRGGTGSGTAGSAGADTGTGSGCGGAAGAAK